MDIFYSILAGVIQGLTEFLPVSSSGHLVLFHDFFNFNLPDDLAFDVVLHLGTLVALVLFFYREIIKYVFSWIQSFFKWDLKNNNNQRLAWYLFLATLPAAFVGYFLEEQIETVFRGSFSVALMLILFGVVLYLADKYLLQVKTIEQLNLNNSLVIGVLQSLALVPGVSRSGITIIAGLSQKLKRGEAARFGFILSMPIVFGAGLKKVLDLYSDKLMIGSDFVILALGFLTSAITGYFCIKYFLQFLQSHSLAVFAVYRIILGIIILLLILWKS